MLRELPYLGRVISFYLPLSDILVPVLLKHGGKKKLQAACSFGGDLGVKFAAQDSFTTARTASEFC